MSFAYPNSLRAMAIQFSTVAVALLVLTASQQARADDKPDEETLALGKRTFLLCQSCHTTEKGGRKKQGPNLWEIFGSKAGEGRDFKFSPAITDSGITWTEETLEQYIENPRNFIPGNRMSFAGIRDEKRRKTLIAYLKQATTESE